MHCYSPRLGQTCCDGDTGMACDDSYYCAYQNKAKTWCCPQELNLTSCAAAFETADLFTVIPPAAEIPAPISIVTLSPSRITAPTTVTVLQSVPTGSTEESRNSVASSIFITKTLYRPMIQTTTIQAIASLPIPSTLEHWITKTVYQPVDHTVTVRPAEDVQTVVTSIIVITKTKHRPIIQEVTSTVTRKAHVTNHPVMITSTMNFPITLTTTTNMTTTPEMSSHNCARTTTKPNRSSSSKVVGGP
ncbi:hypothetical protein BGZ60DRAFT_524260 [Tricladium varicosporioides]|nr:hypothetical protein BGZ60DRAFT_524260 [Hymenoscyphus varicosporioides]